MHEQTKKVRAQIEALGFSPKDFSMVTRMDHERLLTKAIFHGESAILAEKRYNDFYSDGAIDVWIDYPGNMQPAARVTVSYGERIPRYYPPL